MKQVRCWVCDMALRVKVLIGGGEEVEKNLHRIDEDLGDRDDVHPKEELIEAEARYRHMAARGDEEGSYRISEDVEDDADAHPEEELMDAKLSKLLLVCDMALGVEVLTRGEQEAKKNSHRIGNDLGDHADTHPEENLMEAEASKLLLVSDGRER
ncbi:hypothetical protein Syun_025480 [Stephania yunnanensis]|uniref:Uncharacterized protein n=1 Tax=Stephania yunnanensis TaxID=152371 RepID=A0AAP0EUC6_9MAGN